ncbi:MAG: hypothetical protein J6N76_06965, partial [Lachnospiraceae bacterium]|nr:hypothetical protein [Lachnospiraceae bacterium]
MSRYSEIMVVGKKKYPHLIFDDVLPTDIGFYDSYRIPSEEKLVVYAEPGGSSRSYGDKGGTIITDLAIYFHPSHYEWGSDNRIPLSDICSYMVFQENPQDTIHLLSHKKDQSIYGRTVSPQDCTGRELVELLWTLQQNLIRMSPAEKKTYIDTVAELFALVKKGFHENGMLSPRAQKLLDIIGWQDEFLPEITLLRAENEYRRMDEVRYFHFVDEQAGLISDGLAAKLRRPDELFFDSFVEDIANAGAIFMTHSLIEAYTNLKKTERLTYRQGIILSLLCIRLEDWDYYAKLRLDIEQKIPESYLWRIESFRARFANEKLFPVYEKFLSKKEKLSSTEARLSDALGLTPLHYALILRDKALVRSVLEAGDWSHSPSPFPRDKMVDLMYQYLFVASVLYDDMDLIEEILLATTPLAKSLTRSIKRMDDFIFIQRSFISGHEEKREKLLAEYAGLDKVKERKRRAEIDGLIHNENLAIAVCKDRIEEYEGMKREMRSELRVMAVEQVENSRKQAQIIVDTAHPFCKLLFELYMESDSLYRLMADTISTWQIARYKDL